MTVPEGPVQKGDAPTWRRVRRATGSLSTAAVAEMEQLPWFRALPAQDRSYVGLVVTAGVEAFAGWLRAPDGQMPTVFAAAPRELARAVTLQQTVELIRIAVGVVEEHVPLLAPAGQTDYVREQVLRYSREIAFSAAAVYAATAESRGAWDARVEAGVVDALVRGATGALTLSRATSLGWRRGTWVTALAIDEPVMASTTRLPELRDAARGRGISLLSGEAAGALVLVVGGNGPVAAAVGFLSELLPPGPVVVGPVVADLTEAGTAVQEALGARAAVAGWPGAPRPVASGDLLAERAVLGEDAARRRLLVEIYQPLAASGGDLLETATAYLEGGGSLESTARSLFVHANTVRYRLRRVQDVLDRDLTDPRVAFTVRLALVLGRTQVSGTSL